jgi:hypothetical protein
MPLGAKEHSMPAAALSVQVLPFASFASHHTFRSCLAARGSRIDVDCTSGLELTNCLGHNGLKYTTV